MMKATMPLWIGLTQLMLLLVLGAAFTFLFAELNEERGMIVQVEGTAESYAAEVTAVNVTIVAIGDQLTQQAAGLADYTATIAAATMTAAPPSEDDTSQTPTPVFSNTITQTETVTNNVGTLPTPTLVVTTTPSVNDNETTVVSDTVPVEVDGIEIETRPAVSPEPTAIFTDSVESGELNGSEPDGDRFIIPANVTPTPRPEPQSDASPDRAEEAITVGITVTSPIDGAEVRVDQAVLLDALIRSPDGIVEAWLMVNDERINAFVVDRFVEFNYTPDWIPTETGEFVLSVGAMDRAGLELLSQAVKVTVVNTGADGG